MKKEAALTAINEFPEEFNLEQLIEKLILVDKVERGMEQADAGKTISHIEAAAKIKSWQI